MHIGVPSMLLSHARLISPHGNTGVFQLCISWWSLSLSFKPCLILLPQTSFVTHPVNFVYRHTQLTDLQERHARPFITLGSLSGKKMVSDKLQLVHNQCNKWLTTLNFQCARSSSHDTSHQTTIATSIFKAFQHFGEPLQRRNSNITYQWVVP